MRVVYGKLLGYFCIVSCFAFVGFGEVIAALCYPHMYYKFGLNRDDRESVDDGKRYNLRVQDFEIKLSNMSGLPSIVFHF